MSDYTERTDYELLSDGMGRYWLRYSDGRWQPVFGRYPDAPEPKVEYEPASYEPPRPVTPATTRTVYAPRERDVVAEMESPRRLGRALRDFYGNS